MLIPIQQYTSSFCLFDDLVLLHVPVLVVSGKTQLYKTFYFEQGIATCKSEQL